MPWNPDQYNKYKTVRYQPFYDLMDLINGDTPKQAIDLGCGTGEQTYLLSERFKGCDFLGIDASNTMLAKSKEFENSRLHFEQRKIEDFVQQENKWDLIFSNAALQWIQSHEALFPRLISKLNPGGQFAVQMPFQKENVLNQLLLQIVAEEPLSSSIKQIVPPSPVLSLDEYATIMFQGGLLDIAISIRVYPIIANDAMELYDFIAGSALIPYM
ncbi:MAG: methyltransferase domain-containing protein, partial [Sphingobacterium sp.]